MSGFLTHSAAHSKLPSYRSSRFYPRRLTPRSRPVKSPMYYHDMIGRLSQTGLEWAVPPLLDWGSPQGGGQAQLAGVSNSSSQGPHGPQPLAV